MMEKIVGKLFLFTLCLLFFVPLAAQVKLRAFDIAGNVLQKACIGEPFLLEVEAVDSNNAMQAPTIAGLDQFVSKRTGLYMHSINGRSIIKYSYQVRIDQPGTYDIGPAKITDRNQTRLSNVLSISVSNTSMSQVVQVKKVGSADAKEFLRLVVNHDKVVVGQKVVCSLRFYYQLNTIELKQIEKPEIDHCTIKNVQGPFKGTELINDAPYKYLEWKWDFYPLQPGKIVIPSYRADFAIQSKRNHGLKGFSRLFGLSNEQKSVYANAACIYVDSLPYYDGPPAQAVGDFKKIEASITPAAVKKGEGIVLAIEIEGDGDLESIKTPMLKNVPDQLKYYESSSNVIEPNNINMLSKKRFEFIVQGVEAGEWEIPQQSFTYFDVQSYSYKTLQTIPLSVNIIANTVNPSATRFSKQAMMKQQDNAQNLESICPINNQGPWYPIKEQEPINWYLFYCLSSLPFFFWLCQASREQLRRFFSRYYQLSWWQKKSAFRRARTHLERAIAAQDASQIYYIFIKLLSIRWNKADIAISPSIIEQQFYKMGLSKETIIRWNTFFMWAMEHAFTADKKDKKVVILFLKESKKWIKILERVW